MFLLTEDFDKDILNKRRSQEPEDRSRKTEDRRQKSGARRQNTEEKNRNGCTYDKRQRKDDSYEKG
jgi:hypothetical protein